MVPPMPYDQLAPLLIERFRPSAVVASNVPGCCGSSSRSVTTTDGQLTLRRAQFCPSLLDAHKPTFEFEPNCSPPYTKMRVPSCSTPLIEPCGNDGERLIHVVPP